jgi:cell division protein FtsL
VGVPTPGRPTRGDSTSRTRTARRSSERKIERDPEQPGTRATRGRTTAAQRAYARKAGRKKRLRLPAGLKSASRTPFVVLVMALLAAGVMATLFLSISAVSDSYRLEDAKKKTTDLTSRVEQLKADVAKGESPEVLYDEARKLGMVPAPDPGRLKVNQDGSVSVTGSPVAATTTTTPPPSSSTSAPPPSGQSPTTSTTVGTSQPPASGGGH